VSFINYAAVLSVYFDTIKCYLSNTIPPAFCENPSLVQIGLINHATWAINTAADCLMFYRAVVIWQRNLFTIVSLGTLLCAESVLGLVVNIANSASLRKYTLAAIGLSGSFDVIACLFIVVQLLFFRRRAKVLGQAHQAPYSSLITVFLESSALTSTTRIIWVGVRFDNSGFNDARWAGALAVVGSLIGPLLIIVRLAMAISVDVSKTATPPQEIVFANRQRKDHTTDATMQSFFSGAPYGQSMHPNDAKDTPELSSLHLGGKLLNPGRKAAYDGEIELQQWKQSADTGVSDQETTQHTKRYDDYM